MSADGSVVVGEGIAEGDVHEAFRWTVTEGIIGPGHLWPAAPSAGQANRASRDGQTIVGNSGTEYRRQANAFRWTESDGMVGLGGTSDLTCLDRSS